MQLAFQSSRAVARGRAAAPRAFAAAAAPAARAARAAAAAPRANAAAARAAAAPALSRPAQRRVRRCVRVAAGWGDPVEFKPARVVGTRRAAEGAPLHAVLIDVGAEIAQGYTQGGQYLQIKVRCVCV